MPTALTSPKRTGQFTVGIPYGGGGGSRTHNRNRKSIDIARFFVTHLQFHLQFTFPVSA